MKRGKFWISSMLGIGTASAILASEYLFKFAFKRVDYVPETSADKQKYAKSYWNYVNWFKNISKEHWTFSIDGEDETMSAYFIAANTDSKKLL